MQLGNHDDVTIAFCKKHGIVYQSFSPLRGSNLEAPAVVSAAKAHNVSTAQIALRWITQLGHPLAVSPGLNRNYAAEDLGLGSFSLTQAELASLSAI